MNCKQIPVNTPKSPVHSYTKDGAMRVATLADPVYAPELLTVSPTPVERHPV